MTDDLQIASGKQPAMANENDPGPAVTGEPAVSPELQGVFPDQSMPRSPEGPTGFGLVGSSSERPSFTQWCQEYRERMRNAQGNSLVTIRSRICDLNKTLSGNRRLLNRSSPTSGPVPERSRAGHQRGGFMRSSCRKSFAAGGGGRRQDGGHQSEPDRTDLPYSFFRRKFKRAAVSAGTRAARSGGGDESVCGLSLIAKAPGLQFN
jgi:hypothetical protein